MLQIEIAAKGKGLCFAISEMISNDDTEEDIAKLIHRMRVLRTKVVILVSGNNRLIKVILRFSFVSFIA